MAAPSTFPAWVFDNSPIPDPLGKGQKAVDFLRALRHIKSDQPGRAFTVYPFQERMIRAIYGPCDADGARIVQKVFFGIPRGNRKTTLSAAMSLLHLIGPERVPSGEIVFAASDKRQASIAFKEAREIVEQDRRLVKATSIINQRNAAREIESLIPGFMSKLEVISSDGSRQNGGTPTFVLCDEIHAWKEAGGAEMMEVMESGLAKRPNGLMVIATTAGRGAEGFAADEYAYARDVATGKIIDPSYLPILFELQDGEDWTDETVWHRCNPGLQYGFQDIKKLRSNIVRANVTPSAAYGFQQYHLNKWHGNSRDPLFDFAEYDARRFDDDEADLEHLPCYLGVDYAPSGDLSAIVAAWRHDDGQVTIKPWFFVKGEGLAERERYEGLPYRQWVKDGSIIEVPGPVVPQQTVAEQIKEICARHQVEEVAYDPHKFRAAAIELFSDGIPMVEVRQGLLTMGPANGELVRAVNGRLIRHDGHPVLRNHFAGVAAVVNDTGLIWQAKADKKRGHIDGSVAAAMAVGRLALGATSQSAYNRPGAGGIFAF